MSGETKAKIPEVALKLFSQNGYLGTSMNDIAAQLGITKPALYKHYTSKHEILECIVKRMNDMDFERAEEYEMPETEPDGFADAYMKTPIEKIRAYSMAQFRHWTEEEFSAQFRKMITMEQYLDINIICKPDSKSKRLFNIFLLPACSTHNNIPAAHVNNFQFCQRAESTFG